MVIQNGIREEKHKNYKHDMERQWPQILAVLFVSVGAISVGFSFAWSSPFALVISQDKINYDITEDDTSFFIVFQPLGMIFASLFIFKLSEILGRKKAVLFVAVPQLACWLITIFAKDKWGFYAARFIAGISECCAFCCIPPYVGEITTPTVRGFWGNIPTFFVYGGGFIINAMGSYLSMNLTTYICLLFPVVYLVLVYFFLPESPYQLIKDNKDDDARKSIKWLRRKVDIEEDFQSMKVDVDRQLSERGKWKDLFTIKSNRKALRAGIFLRFSQQLCGIEIFASYTQPMFEKAGSNINPQYSSMIVVGLIWVLNLFCSGAVERFGRRMSYFYSHLTSGIILIIMAIYFFLDQYELVNLKSLSWFPLAGIIAFAFTYSFGLGIVPTLMLGELFSASIKSKGLSILMASFGLAVFVTSNIFNLLTSNIGIFAPFLVYGICCLISTVLTLRWVPETKGKTLEEIQQSLKK